MLRELVDRHTLEDLLSGLSPLLGLQLCAYDERRRLIFAGPCENAYLETADNLPPAELPRLDPVRLPADEPPAQVALAQTKGVAYLVAPILVDQQTAGFCVVGGLRLADECIAERVLAENPDADGLRAGYDALPTLELVPGTRPLKAVRWLARQLADLCRRETRAVSVTEKLALVSDIASLMTGESDLQRILDHIVAETAKALDCRFCSLRLYNQQSKELELSAGYNLSERYLNKGVIRRHATSIDDEALQGATVYVEDARSDPRFEFREAAKREGIVSVLTTGILYRGGPVGVIRVYTDRPQRFRPQQRELLRAVAAQAAVAIVNARLIEQRVQAVTLERELKVAGQVQSRMLGGEPPQFDQVEIARVFSPTRTVTGDFCDFFTLCDGRVAAVVADVVGKGVPAALLGAMLRGAMRASAEACHEPGELFRRLNQHMCQETNLGEFATVVMVTISPDGRTLEYCSAGHEPVLLVRGNQVLTLEDGGLVLGVNPDERYEAHTLPVEPNDFLVLYTDGAIDALNFAQENFGRARFNAALRTYAALSTTEAVRSIEWDIRRFVGLAEQADDITLIGLRIKPVPAEVVRRTAAAPDVAATH